MSLLGALRRHPRVRALARRHVRILLARARTWANVDSALRLLAENHRQPVSFGRCADPLVDVLYWQPFVRWAQSNFVLAPEGTGEAVRFPPGPVLALVEEYRRGDEPPRPLLKRTRYVPPEEHAAGGIVPWSADALRGGLAGAPTIAIVADGGAVEADLDLALRVTAELGESLTILSQSHLTRLLQALRGPNPELQ